LRTFGRTGSLDLEPSELGTVKLLELLQQSDGWDEEAAIFVAHPWSCNAEAILVSPAPDTTAPVERHGTFYDYFLETFIAREFSEDYAASVEGACASAERRCERLITYAEKDA
jgi:hypothetical protein